MSLDTGPCGCNVFHKPEFPCRCECHEEERARAWLASMSDELTPSERSDLRKLAERVKEDGADTGPMRWIAYQEDGSKVERIIPWLVAINLDPSLGV